MTDAEQREAARQFVNRWKGKGKEDKEVRSYWLDLLTNVIGMDQANVVLLICIIRLQCQISCEKPILRMIKL